MNKKVTPVYGFYLKNEREERIALEFFLKDIGDDDIFNWFNLEKKEEGETQFELRPAEVLTSIIYFTKGRVDPFPKTKF